MTFTALVQNHLLINALASWLIAQLVKVLLYALVNRRLD